MLQYDLISRTDQIVQEVIKTKFHNSTVISIAHNLNSVLHSDRICVIHGGRIVVCMEILKVYK